MKLSFKIRNAESKIAELVCVLLLYLVFLQYTINVDNVIINYLKIVLSFLLWIYCIVYVKYKIREYIILACLIFYVLLFSLLRFGGVQVVIVYLPIAIFLLKKPKLKKILWVILSTLILFNVLVAWINSPNGYKLYPGMGRNYVSVFAIYSLALFNFHLEKEQKNCSIIFLILVWILSIASVGRGGILSTSIMLILFVSNRTFEKQKAKGLKKHYRVVIATILLLILVIVIYFNLDYITKTFFGRFFGYDANSESSIDTRLFILWSYIRYCVDSVSSFIFGADAKMFSLTATNLHNSYFQLHSQFGIMGLAFVLLGSIKSLKYLYDSKRIDSAIIFIGILIRAFTDWCFPSFPFDAILLYYLLMPYMDSKLKYNISVKSNVKTM